MQNYPCQKAVGNIVLTKKRWRWILKEHFGRFLKLKTYICQLNGHISGILLNSNLRSVVTQSSNLHMFRSTVIRVRMIPIKYHRRNSSFLLVLHLLVIIYNIFPAIEQVQQSKYLWYSSYQVLIPFLNTRESNNTIGKYRKQRCNARKTIRYRNLSTE